MSTITVRRAESSADFDAARALCRSWLDWQLRVYPEHRDRIVKVFEPAAYERTLADLPRIHASPGGAILLADLGDVPFGCVMYLAMEPGVAEIKRLFVDEAGRGHGAGRSLLSEMFGHMRADGYSTVRFSSAEFLTHARRLYESVGFRDIPRPDGVPDYVYFMERPL